MRRSVLAVGFITLLLNSQFIHAAERQLANMQGLSAIVQDGFCGEKAEVKVRTSNASEFSGDKINLQRLIGTLRVALGAECPQAKEIFISGEVGSQQVYQGSVAEADDWALKDRPDLIASKEPEKNQFLSQNTDGITAPENNNAKVDECDMLAAHPNDPSKSPKVRGVSDEEIDGDKAAEACTSAIEGGGDGPRIHFQLGRAFFALGQHELAADQLQEAADAGHAGAKSYLAALYAEGVGVKKSEKMATMLAAEAERGGFKLPQLPEQEQSDSVAFASDVGAFADEAPPASKFDTSGFHANTRDIISIIYSGNFAEFKNTDLKNNRRAIDEYLVLLVDNINYSCPVKPTIVNKMWHRYRNYIEGHEQEFGNQAIDDWLYRFANPEKAGASLLEGAIIDAKVNKMVEHDVRNFVETYPCEGAIARFLSNVGAYMADEPPITDGGTSVQGFAGSSKEPTVTNELGFMVLDYGRVPENFVPEIPSKYLSVQQLSTTPLRVKMIKENVGSLAKIEIKRVGRSSLDMQRTMFSNENPVAEADIIAAFKEGGLVMKCFYLSAVEHEAMYIHASWFGSVPPSADPNRLRQRMRNHPMLVINSPRRSCMATREEALAVGR